MADSDLKRGTVKWFNDQKQFGFITPDDGSEDLFVHQSVIKSVGFRSLGERESVEFVVEYCSDGRAKAASVTGPEGASVQGNSRGSYGGRIGGGGGYNGGEQGRWTILWRRRRIRKWWIWRRRWRRQQWRLICCGSGHLEQSVSD